MFTNPCACRRSHQPLADGSGSSEYTKALIHDSHFRETYARSVAKFRSRPQSFPYPVVFIDLRVELKLAVNGNHPQSRKPSLTSITSRNTWSIKHCPEG